MRPAIVGYLNETFGTGAFNWLVPVPSIVYALMIAVVLLVFIRRARAADLSRYHALGAAIWAGIAALIGARLFYLLLRLPQVIREPGVLLDLSGSTISWGAYLGGLVGFALYFVRKRESGLSYADAAASALGLGPLIGRLACFLNGDDYGKLAEVAWAVSYPRGSLPFVAQAREGVIDPLSAGSLPVHPVQLYMALGGLLLFLVFSWLWKNVRLPHGMLFLLYWAAYGAIRFGLEFFRGDLERTFVWGLPDAQVVALLVSISALVAAASLWKWKPDQVGS